jgi:hypothetical protein
VRRDEGEGIATRRDDAPSRKPEWNRGLCAHADALYEALSGAFRRSRPLADIDLPEYGFGIGVLVMAAGSSKKHPTNVAKTRFWEVVLQAAESR